MSNLIEAILSHRNESRLKVIYSGLICNNV